MNLFESVQERLHQHRDRGFLKAAMAASALAAYADGTVSLTERYSIDDMLENLERLNLHDPKKATQILNGYIHALQENIKSGIRLRVLRPAEIPARPKPHAKHKDRREIAVRAGPSRTTGARASDPVPDLVAQ